MINTLWEKTKYYFLNYWDTGIFVCLFLYVFLNPGKGSGIFDDSLLPLLTGDLLEFLTYLLLIIYLSVRFYFDGKDKKLLLLFILFIVSVFIRYNTLTLGYIMTLTFGVVVYLGFCFNKKIYKIIPYLFILVSLYYVYNIFIFYDKSQRLDFLFLQPNFLGDAISCLCLFLFWYIISVGNKIYIVFLLLIYFCLLFGLVATLSRGASLCFLIGLIISVVYGIVKFEKKYQIVCLFLMTILLFFSMVFFVPNRWSERFDKNCYDTQVSTLNRVELYKKSCLIIAHNPLGVGAGKFTFELDNYNPKFLNHEGFTTCLNSYLTLCAEFGVQTLVLFLLIIIYLFYKACRKPAKDFMADDCHNIRYIYLGLLACGISLLIFGLFSTNINRVYCQFILFTGLFITCQYNENK